MTGEQLRAARALLRIDQVAASALTGVSLPTFTRLEAMKGVVKANASTIKALVSGLEDAGIIFIDADSIAGPGVRLSRPAQEGARGAVIRDIRQVMEELGQDETN